MTPALREKCRLHFKKMYEPCGLELLKHLKTKFNPMKIPRDFSDQAMSMLGELDALDELIAEKTPKEEIVEGWLCVYRDGRTSYVMQTRQEALSHNTDPFALVHIMVRKGDGL